ncbi:S1 family peptidase [Listeria valentina]|uniref:S1 family peptidase n=1 Tax=Listeria valentina TaxID=2705293 RepID=UPI0014320D1F|nr:serine protease [Listeria valentina]
MDMLEQFIHSTVRIVGNTEEGLEVSATGFFFSFDIKIKDEEKCTLFIVTNRHVFEDLESVKLVLTEIKDNNTKDTTHHVKISVGALQDGVVFHPDKNIDLAIMPMGGILDDLKNKGKNILAPCLNDSLFCKEEELDGMQAVEDIAVVGYPNGLWDEVNNLPLVRSGRTATDIRKEFNGERKFIIDCSIYPGSSGSPVILMNRGTYYHNKTVMMGSRFRLLGINSAVYQSNTQGVFNIDPNTTLNNIITPIPNNLGIIIKAECLFDFLPLIERRAEAELGLI